MTPATLTAGTAGGDPTPSTVTTRAVATGVHLWPDAGMVRFTAPGPIPADLRDLIAAHKPALLVYLAEWEPARAIDLMTATDAAFDALGVPGTDPAVVAAADRAAAALRRRDMPALRMACAELLRAGRRLAAGGAG